MKVKVIFPFRVSYLLIASIVYFAKSTAPSVGLTSTDIAPRPIPFMKPSKPSVDAPVIGLTTISAAPSTPCENDEKIHLLHD